MTRHRSDSDQSRETVTEFVCHLSYSANRRMVFTHESTFLTLKTLLLFYAATTSWQNWMTYDTDLHQNLKTQKAGILMHFIYANSKATQNACHQTILLLRKECQTVRLN
jgi:hypothetical protein